MFVLISARRRGTEMGRRRIEGEDEEKKKKRKRRRR
jgi:hypothetical protein